MATLTLHNEMAYQWPDRLGQDNFFVHVIYTYSVVMYINHRGRSELKRKNDHIIIKVIKVLKIRFMSYLLPLQKMANIWLIFARNNNSLLNNKIQALASKKLSFFIK